MIERRSFLGIPEEYTRYERSRFVVLPIPYERTASGARYGPSALIAASHQLERFDEELGFEPWKAGIHTLAPTPIQRDPAKFLKSVANLVEPHVRAGKFLFGIGGEQAVTEGSLSAVGRVVPKVSVLHLNAQGAARRLMSYADKIVQVGVRSVSADEQKCANTGSVRTFLAQQHRDMEALTRLVLGELGENVYVSISLDGLDPSVVPGVGSPAPGGLGWWDTLHLLREVTQAKTVVAADVVELCPLPDGSASELAAARLVYRMMGYVVHKEAQKDTVRRPKPRAKK